MTDDVPALDVAAAARSLEGEPPAAILAWASAQFGAHLTFATGFGADGCVIIDLVARAGLPIDLFALDTGLLFAETYELWRRLEARYGVTIRAVRPEQSVEQQAEARGPTLWQHDPDHCCELRKVRPLRAALAPFAAWITAIRRDQAPERASAQIIEHDHRFGLVKINPLAAWTHDDVWAHIHANDIPYNPLHDRGCRSIGCEPCTSVAPLRLYKNAKNAGVRAQAGA